MREIISELYETFFVEIFLIKGALNSYLKHSILNEVGKLDR